MPAFCRCSSFHSKRLDIKFNISKRFVSSRGKERNWMRKLVMTILSTVEAGEARLSRRNAFVRCSFKITARHQSQSQNKNWPSCRVFPNRAAFSFTSASNGFNRLNSFSFSSNLVFESAIYEEGLPLLQQLSSRPLQLLHLVVQFGLPFLLPPRAIPVSAPPVHPLMHVVICWPLPDIVPPRPSHYLDDLDTKRSPPLAAQFDPLKTLRLSVPHSQFVPNSLEQVLNYPIHFPVVVLFSPADSGLDPSLSLYFGHRILRDEEQILDRTEWHFLLIERIFQFEVLLQFRWELGSRFPVGLWFQNLPLVPFRSVGIDLLSFCGFLGL